MSRVRVHNFSVSLDGFGTGEGQSLEAPFGHAGTRLHEWFFPTRTFLASTTPRAARAAPLALTTPSPGAGLRASVSRSWAATSSDPNADRGTTKSGRAGGATTRPSIPLYMCSPITPGPPSRCRAGRHFTSLTPILLEALRVARESAGGFDVRIGGGPSTIRQFLAADLIDYAHVVIVPIVLGRGESLWDGLEELEQRFDVESVSSPSGVTHLTFTRR